VTQPELDFTCTRKPDSITSGRAAARMIAVLSKRRAWTTRREFAAYGLTDRECRAGRAASNGRIIYGQRGYILLRDSTPDEIRACLSTTASMIAELQRDYKKLCRRAHGVLAGKNASK